MSSTVNLSYEYGIRDPLNFNSTHFGIPFCPIGKIQWVPDPKFGEKIAVELMDNKVEVLSNNLSHI